MKKIDSWDVIAVLSVLAIAAGMWMVYLPAAFLSAGVIGLVLAWLGAGGKR